MNEPCTCSIHSPFRWRDDTEPSIFARDPAFTTGAKKGQTPSQIASATNEAYMARTGRSLGSIPGISDRSDRHIEESNRLRIAAKKAR